MKAVVIEDDEQQGTIWSRALAQNGFRVQLTRCTASGRAALAGTENLDVVIADLHLEDGCTTGLLDYARVKFPSSVILLVTGCTQFHYGELHGFAASADRVLQKPLPVRDLISIVEHHRALSYKITGDPARASVDGPRGVRFRV